MDPVTAAIIVGAIVKAGGELAKWITLHQKMQRGDSFTPEEHAMLDAERQATLGRIDEKIGQLPPE